MSPTGRATWILVVALPALAFGVRALLDARDEGRRTQPARFESAPTAVDPAWTADGEPIPGLRVTARVAPLHGDPGRQAFEAEILRGRYRGIAGDPWLVVLELRGDAAARLDPARIVVADAAGAALAPAERLRAARPSDLDPLATLLGPPAGIGPGERASFVVFGRAPVEPARLVVGEHGELDLVRAAAGERRADLPIARVDAHAALPAESDG